MVDGMKSVLITGCSAGGIGDALCQEFITNNWRVFATARNISKVQHLQALGCDILELDVTDEAAVKASAAQVTTDTDGTLDMLINNAGRVYTGTVIDSDLREVRETFETNVIGVVSVKKTFAPLLLKSKGSIVNIGSITGIIPGPYCSTYGGSKAALELLSHAMRQEMEPLGLKVVHVIGGIVATNVQDNNPPNIPDNSLYLPIKTKAKALMNPVDQPQQSASEFAKKIFHRITRPNPPVIVYEGAMVWPARIMSSLTWIFGPRTADILIGGTSGLHDLAKIVKEREVKERHD